MMLPARNWTIIHPAVKRKINEYEEKASRSCKADNEWFEAARVQ